MILKGFLNFKYACTMGSHSLVWALGRQERVDLHTCVVADDCYYFFLFACEDSTDVKRLQQPE